MAALFTLILNYHSYTDNPFITVTQTILLSQLHRQSLYHSYTDNLFITVTQKIPLSIMKHYIGPMHLLTQSYRVRRGVGITKPGQSVKI